MKWLRPDDVVQFVWALEEVLGREWGTELVMVQYRKYEEQRAATGPLGGEWLFAPGPRILAERIAEAWMSR